MPAQRQLSLLSRGPLLEDQIRRQYIADMRGRGVPEEAARARALREWLDALASTGRVNTRAKETSLEQLFNQKILGQVLGYSLVPGANASAWPKAPTWATGIGKEPDVMLGRFEQDEEPRFVAALELKAPNVPFDQPQVGRKPPLTPVQQAFSYGQNILGVRWVLVSDMQVIRLYSVESPHESLAFDLRRCLAGDTPTQEFRELYWFLARECLVDGDADAPVARLLEKSVSRQLEIRDSFYDVYYRIRADLLAAVEAAVGGRTPVPSRADVLRATQRLLDRMLFLYYCEDNIDRLIPQDTVKSTTEAARRLPGASTTKVYDALKALFREVDEGSPVTNIVRLPAYNGELFKPDPIVDEIDLPDALHDRRYAFRLGDATRYVNGVWGLHEFDFWRELNEHLLGHVFEQSLSDIQALSAGAEPAPDRLRERKQNGIYYTSEVLSDYLASEAIGAVLRDRAPVSDASRRTEILPLLNARAEALSRLRIADMACGSGAFLVSSYQALLEEFWTVSDALAALSTGAQRDLLTDEAAVTQAKLLRDALYGADLLPQAVEIAKLALWLRSARKGEKVPDLSSNVVATDSLTVDGVLDAMQTHLGSFDLVVGNPPWGGEVAPDVYAACCARLGLDPEPRWDSWELFTALGLALLRDGGRLAYVVPDTIFSSEKERTRRLILESGTVEYIHNLGTGWFDNVRMGTVVLQVRRGTVPLGHAFRSLLLSGERRRDAIAGRVPLTQLVSRFGRAIPQDRSASSPTAEIEVFRSVRDDELMRKMDASSIGFAQLCERGRGEEMSKTGLLWICPTCLTATVPAPKRKQDRRSPPVARYRTKVCVGCGFELSEVNVELAQLVTPIHGAHDGARVSPYIDGDDINERYVHVRPTKQLRLDYKGFSFKPDADYADDKLLIRQAGVGLVATIDQTGARVPQSVYWYRLRPEWAQRGYRHEFLLGVLLSRTMAFYIFKRFSEIDPARAHAKVTHTRLSSLPIPLVDFDDREQKRLHDEVVEAVRALLAGEDTVGSREDMRIDVALRTLWGLTADDGWHVTLELAQLPSGQVIRDLYPQGIPRQAVKISNERADDAPSSGASARP